MNSNNLHEDVRQAELARITMRCPECMGKLIEIEFKAGTEIECNCGWRAFFDE